MSKRRSNFVAACCMMFLTCLVISIGMNQQRVFAQQELQVQGDVRGIVKSSLPIGNNDKYYMTIGETIQISELENVTGYDVVFGDYDDKVFTVNSSGLITAVGQGDSRVKIYVDGKYYCTKYVLVDKEYYYLYTDEPFEYSIMSGSNLGIATGNSILLKDGHSCICTFSKEGVAEWNPNIGFSVIAPGEVDATITDSFGNSDTIHIVVHEINNKDGKWIDLENFGEGYEVVLIGDEQFLDSFENITLQYLSTDGVVSVDGMTIFPGNEGRASINVVGEKYGQTIILATVCARVGGGRDELIADIQCEPFGGFLLGTDVRFVVETSRRGEYDTEFATVDNIWYRYTLSCEDKVIEYVDMNCDGLFYPKNLDTEHKADYQLKVEAWDEKGNKALAYYDFTMTDFGYKDIVLCKRSGPSLDNFIYVARGVDYTISDYDTSVVSISGRYIYPQKIGSTTLTVTTSTGKTAKINVEVIDFEMPPDCYVEVGKSSTVTYENNGDYNVMCWSYDPDIVETTWVDGKNILNAKKSGQARIKIVVTGKNVSYESSFGVYVYEPGLYINGEKVWINQDKISLSGIGECYRIEDSVIDEMTKKGDFYEILLVPDDDEVLYVGSREIVACGEGKTEVSICGKNYSGCYLIGRMEVEVRVEEVNRLSYTTKHWGGYLIGEECESLCYNFSTNFPDEKVEYRYELYKDGILIDLNDWEKGNNIYEYDKADTSSVCIYMLRARVRKMNSQKEMNTDITVKVGTLAVSSYEYSLVVLRDCKDINLSRSIRKVEGDVLEFSVADSNVASISKDGILHINGAGSTVIHVTDTYGYVMDIPLIVEDATFDCPIEDVYLPVGATYQLALEYANRNDIRIYSSNENVAVMDEKGLITGVSEGRSHFQINIGHIIYGVNVIVENEASVTLLRMPENVFVDEGESATFSVRARGFGVLNYLWQYKKAGETEWNELATTHTPEISVDYKEERNGMTLRCVVSDNLGNTAVSDEAKLIVVRITKITRQPVSASVDENTIAKFEVEAKGENLRYLWQYKKAGASDWTDWTTKTTATITVAYDKSRDGMLLRCIASGSNGQDISDEVKLTYKKSSIIGISSQPVDARVEENTLASFSVKGLGTQLKYLWQYKKAGASEWTDWTTKTTAAITVAYDKSRDGMSLRCIVTNGIGDSILSDVATLTYIKASDIVITEQPEDTSVEENTLASFAVRATGTKLSYLWQYKKAGASGWTDWTTKTKAAITVAYDKSRDGMSLRCKITDGNGSSVYSDVVTMTYRKASDIVITKQPVSTSVEANTLASFSLTATGTKLTYLWQYKKAGASTWTDWSTKTTAAITVAYDKSRDGMSLRCKITDGNGSSVYSDVVTMTYKKASDIVITQQPVSTSVEANTLASFSVTATGTKLTYLWQYKKAGASTWTDWSTKTKAAITVAYDKSRDGMSLRCVITDGAGNKIITDEAVMQYVK